MINLEVDADLSTITEEAAETVFAGHEYRKSTSKEPSNLGRRQSAVAGDNPQDTHQRGKSHDGKQGITAILDISTAPDSGWFLRTEAGAWYVNFPDNDVVTVPLADS
jgi:hypothetical protein